MYVFSSTHAVTGVGLLSTTELKVLNGISPVSKLCSPEILSAAPDTFRWSSLSVANSKAAAFLLPGVPMGKARAEVTEGHNFPPTQEARKVRIAGTIHLDSRITHTSARIGNSFIKRRTVNSGRGVRPHVSTPALYSHQGRKPSL